MEKTFVNPDNGESIELVLPDLPEPHAFVMAGRSEAGVIYAVFSTASPFPYHAYAGTGPKLSSKEIGGVHICRHYRAAACGSEFSIHDGGGLVKLISHPYQEFDDAEWGHVYIERRKNLVELELLTVRKEK